MLTFLRGIYSVAKAQIAIPLSNHRDNFSWFSKNEQKRALNISRVSERPVIELKKISEHIVLESNSIRSQLL